MPSDTFILPAGENWNAVLNRFQMLLTRLDHSKEWRITVELTKRRSESQNKYLWGVCYPAIIEGGGEALAGWTADDLHEYYLGEWSGWEILEGFGRKRMRPIRRSSKLSVAEFMEFVSFIQQKAAEIGIVIPDPEIAQ